MHLVQENGRLRNSQRDRKHLWSKIARRVYFFQKNEIFLSADPTFRHYIGKVSAIAKYHHVSSLRFSYFRVFAVIMG